MKQMKTLLNKLQGLKRIFDEKEIFYLQQKYTSKIGHPSVWTVMEDPINKVFTVTDKSEGACEIRVEFWDPYNNIWVTTENGDTLSKKVGNSLINRLAPRILRKIKRR